MVRILLVEDDEIIRVTLYDRLVANSWHVEEAKNGAEALQLLELNLFHIVISDIRMPGLDGVELLKYIKKNAQDTDVILMTAYGSVENAVDCLKQGAVDYMLKPFDMDDLTIRVNRLLQMQSFKIKYASLAENFSSQGIIGSSKVLQNMLKLINKVAQTSSTVLITGESGTGKELVAGAIHRLSDRAEKPYIRINCGAIPENLIESELFGHEKGAFTGAHARKAGKFELADGGTLLLDEIGELPLNLQVKLLRVLQEQEIERVGGTNILEIDVRIICATARRLKTEVEAGRFREDLFYRLQVFPIEAPTLRERKEDIPLLCEYFLTRLNRGRKQPVILSQDALNCLCQYGFPGNIRELKNILERASILTDGNIIQLSDLPADITGIFPEKRLAVNTLAAAVALAERNCIYQALEKTGHNKTKAAALLGISRKNLWEKLKIYHPI